MKTRIPILITGVVGIFMILKFFWAGPLVKAIAAELEQWGLLSLAFAIILGVLNLARINLKAVMERKKDWGYKLILLVSMFSMMAAGGVKWYRDVQASRAQAAFTVASDKAAKLSPVTTQETLAKMKATRDEAKEAADKTAMQFAFDQVYTPLSSTIFALLAFYVASAAFRAFRAKSFYAGLMLVTALLVMIGRVPIGAALSPWFPYVQDWLMIWPNTAGQRAILMGAAIGMIATGLRVIFGIERPYLKG